MYNDLYSGEEKVFANSQEQIAIIEMIPDWRELDVLEIGCGEGQLAVELAERGGNVTAVDFSEVAIQSARNRCIMPDRLQFHAFNYKEITAQYDVIVMQGVLEHLTDPLTELNELIKRNLNNRGTVITSSPNFLNPRGYVWMTFQYLLGIEMSLADLHFFTPDTFKGFCTVYEYDLSFESVDQDWGAGERTITDYNKRFKSALFNSKFKLNENRIDLFLNWLSDAVKHFEPSEYSGANVVYKITKRRGNEMEEFNQDNNNRRIG